MAARSAWSQPAWRSATSTATGKNDLALAGGSYGASITTVEIHFGDGRGGFTSTTSFEVNDDEQIVGLAAGDVNGDGLVDLVLAVVTRGPEGPSSGFLVLPNRANGGQGFVGPFLSNPFYTDPGYDPGVPMALADFNSDGIDDVALSSLNTGVNVFYGLRDGGFAEVPGVFPGSDAGAVPWLSTGDLNGDGRTDLLVIDATSISVLLQPMDGGLGPIGPQLGRNDLFAGLIAGSTLIVVDSLDGGTLYHLNADGGFDSFGVLAAPAGQQPGDTFTPILAVDLNADGLPDLLASKLQTLAVWMNHGANGFGQAMTVDVGSGFAAFGSTAVGDLNGDGRPDIAQTGKFADVAILLSQCPP